MAFIICDIDGVLRHSKWHLANNAAIVELGGKAIKNLTHLTRKRIFPVIAAYAGKEKLDWGAAYYALGEEGVDAKSFATLCTKSPDQALGKLKAIMSGKKYSHEFKKKLDQAITRHVLPEEHKKLREIQFIHAEKIRSLERKGHQIGFCTNTDLERNKAWMQIKGFSHVPLVGIQKEASYENAHEKNVAAKVKPHPRPLLTVLNTMREKAGKLPEIFMVGDNKVDMLSAKRLEAILCKRFKIPVKINRVLVLSGDTHPIMAHDASASHVFAHFSDFHHWMEKQHQLQHFNGMKVSEKAMAKIAKATGHPR